MLPGLEIVPSFDRFLAIRMLDERSRIGRTMSGNGPGVAIDAAQTTVDRFQKTNQIACTTWARSRRDVAPVVQVDHITAEEPRTS